MSALSNLLDFYRTAAASEREKGTYFEELFLAYLQNEASYRDLYAKVWTYADWAGDDAIFVARGCDVGGRFFHADGVIVVHGLLLLALAGSSWPQHLHRSRPASAWRAR